MREPAKDLIRLQHILEAISRIKRYVDGKSFEEFVDDDMLYYAVVKNIEIIGEASNLLTDGFKSNHPQTPWKMVAGMRNYIVHEYFQVDNTVIWDVVIHDLPELEKQVIAYLKK